MPIIDINQLLGRESDSILNAEDTELEGFFTDAKQARNTFEQLITADKLPKYLLVIHGIGGVGKSTLLRMYRLHCRRRKIPIALVEGQGITSPADILVTWANDLKDDGVKFSNFLSTLSQYYALQTKVYAEAQKTEKTLTKAAGNLGKTATKTVVEMATSAIPIIGPFAAPVAGMSTEVVIDWLRGFLSKPDLEFYLNPTKKLTDDFRKDLTRAASRQRIVLMADTYEQMSTFDDWMRDFAKKLSKNILLVIAGRNLAEWSRDWPGWMGKAEIILLKEMTSDDIRLLVSRYYTHICDREPDTRQVDAIVSFARGLPIAATTVVQLWVRYGIEDFQTVKPQVVADLVERLLEGIPQDMLPVFEAAAILRYFNADSLKMLLGVENADLLYQELHRWPFVRARREGLAVHDTVREMMNEALQIRTPKVFQKFQKLAVSYYEEQLEKTTKGNNEGLLLEYLYHNLRVDERLGVELCLRSLEEATQKHTLNFGNLVVQELTNIDIAKDDVGKVDYAKGLLNLAWNNFSRATKSFRKALETGTLSDDIKFEAMKKLAYTLTLQGDLEEAVKYYKECLKLAATHQKPIWQIKAWNGIETALRRQGYIAETIEALKNSITTCVRLDMQTSFEMAWAQDSLGIALGIAGSWQKAVSHHQNALDIYEVLNNSYNVAIVLHNMTIITRRQYQSPEIMKNFQKSLSTFEKLGDARWIGYCRLSIAETLIMLADFQNAAKYIKPDLSYDATGQIWSSRLFGDIQRYDKQWDKAIFHYKKALEISSNQKRYRDEADFVIRICSCLLEQNAINKISKYLEGVIEALRQQESYDFLAQLFLIRGHIAFGKNHFDECLNYYYQALIYALNYNRFLLDEILSRQSQNMPLSPIILFCSGKGEQGRNMLVAIRDWWQVGSNELDIPNPTLSPIQMKITLIEAEKIARKREPGDGLPQKSLIDQIEFALT